MHEVYRRFIAYYVAQAFDTCINGVGLFTITAADRETCPALAGFNVVWVSRVGNGYSVELG